MFKALSILFVLLVTACAQNPSTVTHSTPQLVKSNPPSHTQRSSKVKSVFQPALDIGYRCDNAKRYYNRVVGSGHCVALVQRCSDVPLTRYWRPGPYVKGLNLKPGTIIATFRNGRYPNRSGWHAAVYISQNAKGIWVWDQWRGRSVKKRLIRFNNPPRASNNGDLYKVVVSI